MPSNFYRIALSKGQFAMLTVPESLEASDFVLLRKQLEIMQCQSEIRVRDPLAPGPIPASVRPLPEVIEEVGDGLMLIELALHAAKIEVQSSAAILAIAARKPDGSGQIMASFDAVPFVADIKALVEFMQGARAGGGDEACKHAKAITDAVEACRAGGIDLEDLENIVAHELEGYGKAILAGASP